MPPIFAMIRRTGYCAALLLSACTHPCVLPESQLASQAVVGTSSCPDAVECLRRYPGPLAWVSIHRGGGRQLGAQNTRAGIGESVRRKMPLIEIDVREAEDGSLFLFHDHHLSPENFSGPTRFMLRNPATLRAEERALITVDPAHEEHIPSFADALTLVAGSATAAQLDIKGDVERLLPKIVFQVRSAHAERNVVVQCRDLAMLRDVRAKYPDLPVLFRATSAAKIAPALPFRPEIVQVDVEWSDGGVLRTIHDGGSRVLVKTLSPHGDYSRTWRTLFEAGVDIILSDYPVRIGELLASCRSREHAPR